MSTINEINFEQILLLYLSEPSKENVISAIEKLYLVDGIKYAGANTIEEYDMVPNDILYTNMIEENGQWALDSIDAENAWDFTIGSRNIRVGVMDTGISSHEDLNGNVVNAYDFYSSSTDDPVINRTDIKGHGTHVAGIIGAEGNNNLGITGVNWNISIVQMRVGTTGFNRSAVVKALNWAKNNWNTENRIDIISYSSGVYDERPDYEAAIRGYTDVGGLFVCSTGNKERNNDLTNNHHYPSFYASSLYENPIPNMITVGRSNINDEKPYGANWGNSTIMLFAPGQHILSTYPEEFGGTTIGYSYLSGSSMATPQVSGVAALLLSLNSDLTASQLKTAILESVDIPNVNGSNPLEDLCVTDGRLNAYNAVRYVLENYMNPTTYILGNYSSTINTNKTIASDASYFDELNGFYKLNVTYAKNYEFISSSTNGIEVTLYDEEFDEILYSDLDLSNNKVHFINNLNVGTYYLRIKYTDEDNTGTINTKIVSRNTVYLSNGINDILINTYNGISEYTYAHNQGAGFYKFKLNVDNITSYQSGTIKIYTDQERTILLDRFENDVFFYTASSNTNENEMYVFLPSNGTYYIDILLNNINYSSVTLEIEEVEVKDLNYSASLSSPSFNLIFENVNKYNYFEKVIVDATSKVQIDVIANGTLSGYVPILMFKEEVNLQTPVNNREYYLQTVVFGEANSSNYFPTYTVVVDPGTYYIGYILNDEKVFMSIGLTRLVEYSDNMDDVLVADPYYIGYDLGTEVLLNNGNCDNYTITEGFTRNIYLMVEDRLSDPMSRLQYDWYSSNESIATVSNYGTVLAMPVENNTTVTIFAVLKEDPSIVYFKTFTILNDEEEDFLEISLEMSYSYSEENGTYQLELTNTNCPYPMIQYYNWTIINENDETVSLNYWGQVTSTGPGEYVILGTYALNPRVRIYINLSITD